MENEKWRMKNGVSAADAMTPFKFAFSILHFSFFILRF